MIEKDPYRAGTLTFCIGDTRLNIYCQHFEILCRYEEKENKGGWLALQSNSKETTTRVCNYFMYSIVQ